MVSTEKVLEQLMGKKIGLELELYLEKSFESFTTVKSKYVRVVEQLRNELGTSASVSVEALVDAIEGQTASNLFFSGFLGLKANWDHFVDPIARTVLDVDFDVFLREDTARQLPKYIRAQIVIDSFYAQLTTEQKELFEDVVEYISYLETTGPKLAHYYGYILGNDILYNLVPGYYPDNVLTSRYESMLACYLGRCGAMMLN